MGLLQRLFGLGVPDHNARLIERLHEQLVRAVRQPPLYLRYGVADTFDGRFETLMLFATLMLRRLNDLPAPAPEVGQKLVDAMMQHFDIALRQEGISDVGVPKRIKKYAQALAGRFSAYRDALSQSENGALEAAIGRNLGEQVDAARLARYARACEQAFMQCDLAVFTDGDVPFPDPGSEQFS